MSRKNKVLRPASGARAKRKQQHSPGKQDEALKERTSCSRRSLSGNGIGSVHRMGLWVGVPPLQTSVEEEDATPRRASQGGNGEAKDVIDIASEEFEESFKYVPVV